MAIPEDERHDLLVKVQTLRSLCLAIATGGKAGENDYYRLRAELKDNPSIADIFPFYVKTVPTLSAFRAVVFADYRTYEERRKRINQEFFPVIQRLEHSDRASSPNTSPQDQTNDSEESMTSDPSNQIDQRRVFVVHGRNTSVRDAMFDFLRAVGLDPMQWSTAVSLTGKSSPYIGEVLEAGFARCKAAVVILTGDDEVRLRKDLWKDYDEEYEHELTPQARPNVIFEAGYAFGRFPDRTILIEVGRTRPFSDVLGRHVVRFSGGIDQRHELIQRLKTSGCLVDDSAPDWMRSGNFSASMGTDSGTRSRGSPRNNAEAELVFSNLSERNLSIFWVNFDGIEEFHSKIAPNQSYTQPTFVGHIYCVRNSLGMVVKEVVAQEKPLDVWVFED